MPEKRKRPFSVTRFIFNLVTVVPSIFSMLRHIALMVEHEAHIAGKNLFKLCVLSIFALTILISMWLCVLAMLFIYFNNYLQFSPLAALSFLLIINLIFLSIIALIIRQLKRGIIFPETRELIKTVYRQF